MDDDDHRIIRILPRATPLLMGLTLLFSCGRDVEKVPDLTNVEEIPAVHATNVETIYSDSSIVRLKINAPELKEFPDDTLNPPQIEFPKGLTATFYNQQGGTESILKAGYAIYYKKDKIFEARNHVVVNNLNQDQRLETELLFWDEKKEEIWSDQPVKIITPEGTTYGDQGFNADQNFTRYIIRGSRGEMKVKDKKSGGGT